MLKPSCCCHWQYQGAVNPSRDISKIARYKLFATTGKIHSWLYLDLQLSGWTSFTVIYFHYFKVFSENKMITNSTFSFGDKTIKERNMTTVFYDR